MFRLLNIELHKLKYSKSSKVLLITYFGLLTCIALLAMVTFNIGFFQINLAEQGIFNFPYIWHFNTYIASWLNFFLLFIMATMVASEYSNKTLKQNLIDGLSKKEFVLSKFYTVILFSGLSTIFVFIVSLILGIIYSNNSQISAIFSDLEYLVAYFIQLVCFFSFGIFFAILVKRSAFSIAAMIVWYIIENALKWYFYYLFAREENTTEKVDTITQFFPLQAMGNLIKEPFTKLDAIKKLSHQIGEEITKDFSVHLTDSLIVLVWIFLFVFMSYLLLKKRDL